MDLEANSSNDDDGLVRPVGEVLGATAVSTKQPGLIQPNNPVTHCAKQRCCECWPRSACRHFSFPPSHRRNMLRHRSAACNWSLAMTSILENDHSTKKGKNTTALATRQICRLALAFIRMQQKHLSNIHHNIYLQ